MKHPLLISTLFLSILFASCSDNDEPGGGERGKYVIEFSKPFVNHISRATASSAGTLSFDAFNIYGFVSSPDSHIYEGDIVSEQGGKWVCERPEYWYPNQTYHFTAIAPADGKGVKFEPSTTVTDKPTGGGTVSYDLALSQGTEDLLYSFETVSTDRIFPPPPVEMQFDHLLSQIKFTFYNELNNPHYFINVNWIQINNAPSTGQIDMAAKDPAWQRTDGSTTWLPVGQAHVIHTGSPVSSPSVCVLPVDITGMSIMLKIQVFFTQEPYGQSGYAVTEEHTVTVPFPTVTLQRGRAYNLICHLTNTNVDGEGDKLQPISFTVTEWGWMWDYFENI